MSERERLPGERSGPTVKLEVYAPEGQIDLYVTANTYADGRLGEVFVRGASKEGSTLNGLMDEVAKLISISLQSGADIPTLCRKLTGSTYPPNGRVSHPAIRFCTSLWDAIAKWLAYEFGTPELRRELDVLEPVPYPPPSAPAPSAPAAVPHRERPDWVVYG
jgi:ribonucleoside-diphosphate reductase alpha chain